MSERVSVINVSPVAQAVPGYGEAAPGKSLSVDPRVAVHLLKSEAWQEPRPVKKGPGSREQKAAPAEESAPSQKGKKEVSNGAD